MISQPFRRGNSLNRISMHLRWTPIAAPPALLPMRPQRSALAPQHRRHPDALRQLAGPANPEAQLLLPYLSRLLPSDLSPLLPSDQRRLLPTDLNRLLPTALNRLLPAGLSRLTRAPSARPLRRLLRNRRHADSVAKNQSPYDNERAGLAAYGHHQMQLSDSSVHQTAPPTLSGQH